MITVQKVIVVLLVLATLFAAGCTGSNDEDLSEATPISEQTTEDVVPTIPADDITQIEESVYGIGETASDGLTKITINGVRDATTIDEEDNEFMVAESGENERFVILDITLENISPDRSRSYGQLWHYKMLDSDGYTYDTDFDADVALSKHLDGQDVLPGQLRRGEIAFRIPDTAQNLQLQFMFDPLNNLDAAVFEIE